MNAQPASGVSIFSAFEQIRLAREVLRAEGEALLGLAAQVDRSFCSAVQLLFDCSGAAIVTGMGKAGLVGQKIAATLASTGTRSHFLHPSEAVHGDLGRVHRSDVVLMLSFSGETDEVVRLLPSLEEIDVPVIAVTGNAESRLGRRAAVTLNLGPLREACTLGLAPSTSTTAMLALGDALALVASRMRQFGPEDFARFHPGGSLGRKLAKVDEVMRPLDQCRVAEASKSVRQVLVDVGRPGRRSGAVMLTDADGELTGVFTDSDLARLFESNRDAALDRPIREVMTASPATVTAGEMLPAAIDLLVHRKISELPVVDGAGTPRGMIDITDVVSLLPPKQPTSPAAAPLASPSPLDSAPSQPPTLPFPNHS